MPYILSPQITTELPGLWFEGPAYEKNNIYSIEEGKLPPVNYDTHTLKPHSLTHAEGSSHTNSNGKTIEQFFVTPTYFYGHSLLVRLPGNEYQLVDEEKGIYHWEVSLEELQTSIARILGERSFPAKLLLTTDFYPLNQAGFHDPNYVLTLSQAAADWLVDQEGFDLYGTSWKSSDFKPGSAERPIHNTLFQTAVIFECLDLKDVPEGEYFFVGFPLPLKGASESPVCPVLFEKDELGF